MSALDHVSVYYTKSLQLYFYFQNETNNLYYKQFLNVNSKVFCIVNILTTYNYYKLTIVILYVNFDCNTFYTVKYTKIVDIQNE